MYTYMAQERCVHLHGSGEMCTLTWLRRDVYTYMAQERCVHLHGSGWMCTLTWLRMDVYTYMAQDGCVQCNLIYQVSKCELWGDN